MIYIIVWLTNYIALASQGLVRYRGRLFALGLMFPFGAIAFCRGQVGTDTPNYERMLSEFSDDFGWTGREPGFVGVGWAMAGVFPSDELAVRGLALLFFSLLVLFVMRSDRNERFLLLAYVLPAFAFQYSMNGLRVGLASVVLMLAVQSIRRNGLKVGYMVGGVAPLLHYSTALPLMLMAAARHSWVLVAGWVAFAVGVLLMVGVTVGLDGYFLSKLEVYKELEAPGPLSGISNVLVLSVILVAVSISTLPRVQRVRLVIIGAVSGVAAWYLSQYSYAGLRVLDVIMFSFPLLVLMSFSHVGRRIDPYVSVALIGGGLLLVVATFRRFLIAEGVGRSPFLPYQVGSWCFG